MFKDTRSDATNSQQTPELKRSIARKLARPLRPEELESVAAGTGSCSACRCDDSDAEPVKMM